MLSNFTFNSFLTKSFLSRLFYLIYPLQDLTSYNFIAISNLVNFVY
jgi:hypothetical protein